MNKDINREVLRARRSGAHEMLVAGMLGGALALTAGLVLALCAGLVARSCQPEGPVEAMGTDRIPLVMVAGQVEQLQSGDNLNVGTGLVKGAAFVGTISSPTSVSGVVNNYTCGGTLGTTTQCDINCTGGGNCDLTGLAAQVNGYRVCLRDVGTQTVNLDRLNGSSSAANQLCTLDAPGHLPAGGTNVCFDYDTNANGGSGCWVQESGLGSFTFATQITLSAGLSVSGGAGNVDFQPDGLWLYMGRQVLTSASGTYTPTTGARGAIVRMCGGGGGGGGATSTTAAVGGGGASGSWIEFHVGFASGTITGGAFTNGAAGTAGSSGGGGGGTGGDTTLVITSVTATAKGGLGGGGLGNQTPPFCRAGGNTQTGSGLSEGSFDFQGGAQGGTGCVPVASSSFSQAGNGGSSVMGVGGFGSTSGAGTSATGFCSGGGGAATFNASAAGGAGTAGVIVIDEWR